MAATKKTGTTKKTNKKASARVLSEKELQTLIDAVPDERRKLAANIVSELSWMSKMMDTLKSEADEIGPLEWFVQGEQSMLRENPALKSYNTTIKNYATLLSKLICCQRRRPRRPQVMPEISLMILLPDVTRIDSLPAYLQPYP